MTKLPALLGLFLLLAGIARADVHLPGIFGDHMVLEQDIKIPVWGTAGANEPVSVTLGDKTARTTADASGKWRVNLDPVPTTTTPLTLTVTGKNTVKFEDVLVGDVWVCAGQSNMAFALAGAHNSKEEIPLANDPQLRMFVVHNKPALEPLSEIDKGTWRVCTPRDTANFSAVGYFFGRELRRNVKRPIGLIAACKSGMPAQAFTSLSGLQKDPPYVAYTEPFKQFVAAYPKAKEAYAVALSAYEEEMKKNASPPPLRPPSPEPPPYAPTVLFNSLVNPIIPYGIKGVIWYQGESNGTRSVEYQTLFPRMIADWREKWAQVDFPFLFVQSAHWGVLQTEPAEGGGWTWIREAQLKTLSVPHTGMASAVDVGEAHNVHPADKLDVGLRLARVARHVVYGEDIVYSGPLYDSMKIEGDRIRLSFKHTGGGLQIASAPWVAPGQTPLPTTELTGFAICGADQKFVWAKAQIDGTNILVSAAEVPTPVAVRYGWGGNPPCNLYNKEGLPASPFRTDDWPGPPDLPLKPLVPASTTPEPTAP